MIHKIKIGYIYFCKLLLCLLKFVIVALPFGILWNKIKFSAYFLEQVYPTKFFDAIDSFCYAHGYLESAWFWAGVDISLHSWWTTSQVGPLLCFEVLLMLASILVYTVTPVKKLREINYISLWLLLLLLGGVLILFAIPCVISIAILLIYYCIFSEYAPQVWHAILMILAAVGAAGAVMWICAISYSFTFGLIESGSDKGESDTESDIEPKQHLPNIDHNSKINLKSHIDMLSQIYDVKYIDKNNGSFIYRDFETDCEFWVVPTDDDYTAWRIAVDDSTCRRLSKIKVAEIKQNLQEWVNKNCQTAS